MSHSDSNLNAQPAMLVQDLEFASERIADFAITAVRHDKAINLLGALSILDCPPKEDKSRRRTIDIVPAAAESAFSLMATQCASKKASGTIQTSSGLQYALFAKIDASNEPAVTGCEDAVCTPAIELNGSGDCPNVGNDERDGCAYFCEATAARYYGVPTIYDDTRYCANGCNVGNDASEFFNSSAYESCNSAAHSVQSNLPIIPASDNKL
ncbi:hypothetical protein DL95DRAFT_466974 [Leptodontidium sp. 2 PMI_412]|nr:hypothetical protein DL95DRAFT_466974 [Leptodontidium sp. 2 PMI_412]